MVKDQILLQEGNKARLKNLSKENKLHESNQKQKQDQDNNRMGHQIGSKRQKQRVMDVRSNHRAERPIETKV